MFESHEKDYIPAHPEITSDGQYSWLSISRGVNMPWLHCEVEHVEQGLNVSTVKLFCDVESFIALASKPGCRLNQIDVVYRRYGKMPWTMKPITKILEVSYDGHSDHLIETSSRARLLFKRGNCKVDLRKISSAKSVFDAELAVQRAESNV